MLRCMDEIPSASAVSERLVPLNYAQLEELSRLSGVPFHTLRKIRDRETENPRIDTVGQFWPHIDSVQRAAA